MNFNFSSIYQRVLKAQEKHNYFIDATKKNLSYFLFGKPLSTGANTVIDIPQALSNIIEESDNPLSYLVKSFCDEIANSQFESIITPEPVSDEPYESYADILEGKLNSIYKDAERDRFLKPLLLELLSFGYFGIYTNGSKVWFLSATDLIPGDPEILRVKDQPMMIRKTRIPKKMLYNFMDPEKIKNSFVSELDEFETVPLFDVWIKPLDLNLCFLAETGELLYKQQFPTPKRYPIFVGKDDELLTSFYPKPLFSYLKTYLIKYQKANEQIEESAKSLATPLLVYDADSGIDVTKLTQALREGYKRIIIGKNREGDIHFKSPAALPPYALQQPYYWLDQMMKGLGLTEAFLGAPTRGIRERGAIGTLLRTAFRKLGFYVAIFEDVFTETSQYILDYWESHKLLNSDKTFNLEEIFGGPIRYSVKERFKGFSTQDTQEAKNYAIIKFSKRLIPQEEALRELGYSKPKKILQKIRNEMKSSQDFAIELKNRAERPPKSLIEQVSERLKGELKYRFYVSPIHDDKVLVKCAERDLEMAAFLLSDFTGQVKLETLKKPEPKPPEQKSKELTEKPETPKPVQVEAPEAEKEETRGRPPAFPKIKEPVSLKEVLKAMAEAKKGQVETVKPLEGAKPHFDETFLKQLIAKRTTIRNPSKYLNLQGLYIVEPHAFWIFNGKKSALVKARFYDIKDKPLLLCGDKVYGVIIIRDIIEDFDFDETQKYHLVDKKEAAKWWKGKKLYLYLFEFHPFAIPLEYEKYPGIQNFIKEVKIKNMETGVPAGGDLKPMVIKPFKVPPPHKPEKKALSSNEVFNVKRLMEIIPEGQYNVSEKIDGVRCLTWVVDGQVKMFSDNAKQFNPERLKPLAKELIKIFKHNVLLDGELDLKGVERKDVTGYLFSLGEPSAKESKALRYYVWDVLYVKDRPIANLAFSKRAQVLDLYLPFKEKQTGKIIRVKNINVDSVAKIPEAINKVRSAEGAVIRDVNAQYWATHSTFKFKSMFDVDARVFAVARTKLNLPIFYCELRDGTYIGATYAQAQVEAKPGDIIRVNVHHVSIRPDGSVNWYAPTPKSIKEKVSERRPSLTQVGIGGADTLGLIKEIYLQTGGTQEKWDAWYPLHLEWKKNVMPGLKEKLIKLTSGRTLEEKKE